MSIPPQVMSRDNSEVALIVSSVAEPGEAQQRINLSRPLGRISTRLNGSPVIDLCNNGRHLKGDLLAFSLSVINYQSLRALLV